jgi:hypothetical protein
VRAQRFEAAPARLRPAGLCRRLFPCSHGRGVYRRPR